jgi:predicted nucleic acid-binding protein
MRVVSNTSPLSNLAIIGHLGLVREQLGIVLIPPTVRAELLRNPHPKARSALEAAIQEGWIRVVPLAGAVSPAFAASLDLGEAEALALALETKAPMVLLDESAARLQAKQLGLTFTGVLGLLRHAKQTGRIPSLKEQINRLRTEARFFVNPALEKALIISVGEN